MDARIWRKYFHAPKDFISRMSKFQTEFQNKRNEDETGTYNMSY